MVINIAAKDLDITPALKNYIEKRLFSLDKLLGKFEARGEIKMDLEILRNTKHHRKGQVFSVKAELFLPRKVLRAIETADDARKAVDVLKNKLRSEISKYSEIISSHRTKETSI